MGILHVFILLLCATGYDCELFTSITALHQLMKQGQGHVWAVERLAARLGHNGTTVLNLLSEIQNIYSHSSSSIEHPVTSLHILKHFRSISTFADKEFSRDLKHREIIWPSAVDLTGAYHALARIQYTYNLDVGDVIGGKIHGFQSPYTMNDGDVAGIVEQLNNMGYKSSTQQWLRRDRVSGDGTVNDSLPINRECLKCKSHTESQSHTQSMEYETSCRNSLSEHYVIRNSMFCSYRTRIIPYFRYKQEVFSVDPVIVMFHDVITELEILLTKRVGQYLMETSAITVSGKQSDLTSYKNRVGQVGWVYDNVHPIIAAVSERIGDLIGVSTKTLRKRTHAEPLQVCNYGIGGHFRPHQDAFSDLSTIPEMARGSGNRDATFMFYLTDVAAGGATVFPKLGISIKSVRKAAAFWFNVKRSGERDSRLLHAGCPVLVGNKWIANKWLWSVGQTFARKCGLSPDATDEKWLVSS